MNGDLMGLPKGWTAAKLEEILRMLDSERIPLNSSACALRKGPYPYYEENYTE